VPSLQLRPPFVPSIGVCVFMTGNPRPCTILRRDRGHRERRARDGRAVAFGGDSNSKSESEIASMARWLPVLALVSLSFVACSSSQSAPFAAEADPAKRGYAQDAPFAELSTIAGVRATRSFRGLIELRFSDPELLPAIAAVFERRKPRAVEVEASGNVALEVRRDLIMRGIPESSVTAFWNDEVDGVVLRVSY
jgi:hypothetical protein